MKYKLTKAEFDALTKEQQALYKVKGDAYVLQLEGVPDLDDLQSSVTNLTNKNNELIGEKRKEQEKLQKAEEARLLAENEAKAKAGDVTALNAQWQAKVDAAEKKANDQAKEYIDTITELTTGTTSISIAAELAVEGDSELLEPHIRSRLKTEYKEGKANVIVLGKDGKPSAMTLDELKTEISTDKRFASIISGSKANGSGGVNSNGSADTIRVKPGSLAGTREERVAALKTQFPDLR